tara:strand:- start:17 stop:427 length:411 start_codon:yes stop_codon:yes gene_type:complete
MSNATNLISYLTANGTNGYNESSFDLGVTRINGSNSEVIFDRKQHGQSVAHIAPDGKITFWNDNLKNAASQFISYDLFGDATIATPQEAAADRYIDVVPNRRAAELEHAYITKCEEFGRTFYLPNSTRQFSGRLEQ